MCLVYLVMNFPCLSLKIYVIISIIYLVHMLTIAMKKRFIEICGCFGGLDERISPLSPLLL